MARPCRPGRAWACRAPVAGDVPVPPQDGAREPISRIAGRQRLVSRASTVRSGHVSRVRAPGRPRPATASWWRSMRISASFRHAFQRDRPSSDTAPETIRKISFKPANRRSSHLRPTKTGLAMPNARPRSGGPLPRWHRFSAPSTSRPPPLMGFRVLSGFRQDCLEPLSWSPGPGRLRRGGRGSAAPPPSRRT